MKKLIICLFLLLVTTSAGFAASGAKLLVDKDYKPINGFAPNGLLSAALTVNDTAYDMSGILAFSVYAPADCKVRLKASASKSGTVSETVIGGQWNTIVVSPATPFVSISGCTSGVLRRQN